jgi:two-component system cell cycle sensor histidine kinase/response regulator CckA
MASIACHVPIFSDTPYHGVSLLPFLEIEQRQGTRNALTILRFFELPDDVAPHLPGRRLDMIAVGDTGTGMTEEISQQIFEPFFTTKEWGSQTSGLGLSTCYGVVAEQGGHIRVHTRPGKGSTFRIYLSRQPLAADNVERTGTPAARPREILTVLVVDDEPGVRKLASRILKTRGYSVLEAASGAEACVVARAWHGRIHLLIADVVMPEMS